MEQLGLLPKQGEEPELISAPQAETDAEFSQWLNNLVKQSRSITPPSTCSIQSEDSEGHIAVPTTIDLLLVENRTVTSRMSGDSITTFFSDLGNERDRANAAAAVVADLESSMHSLAAIESH